MNSLATSIRSHLPAGYSVSVGKLASGHISVHVAYRDGAYNLVITKPDEPISAEQIASNAIRFLEDDAA